MENIKEILTNWFCHITESYKCLSIKFEYSEQRGLYLVSFSPKSEIDKRENLCTEIMDFDDKLNEMFGDKAPLFCDEEEYFKLSDKAEVFCYKEEYLKLSNNT